MTTAERLAMSRSQRLAAIRGRRVVMTPETARLLQAGKLEKTCPDCGRTEAASPYCSLCFYVMESGDWYRNHDMARRAEARQDAPQNPSTRVKRGPGRPRADTAIRAEGAA